MLDKMIKYVVFHLVRHTRSVHVATAEHETETPADVEAFHRAWEDRVLLAFEARAMGLAGEWDRMAVYGMEELSAWEAMQEEHRRRYGHRVEKSISFPGVSHSEFVRATERVEHYRTLRALGAFPGGGESDFGDADGAPTSRPGNRYLVFHFVRHSRSMHALTPELEAEAQAAVNAFILSWAPRVRLVLGAHSMGLAGDWDWLGIFGVNELSDWEAMREEYRAAYGDRTEKSLSLPGVSSG